VNKKCIICGPSIYKYKGWLFEIHSFCGPWPLKKNGDPKERAGRIFWKLMDEFHAEKNQKKYMLEKGGCRAF